MLDCSARDCFLSKFAIESHENEKILISNHYNDVNLSELAANTC